MAFTRTKADIGIDVIETKQYKVKGGKGKKRYKKVTTKEQMVIETEQGPKHSETYLSGDSMIIQDMIEALYGAKSRKQFKNIQVQFKSTHPDLTARMLKDPVIMFAIPKWEEETTRMQDFMQLGNVGGMVASRNPSDQLMSVHTHAKAAEEKRLEEQRHKSPDIGSSRLWDR